MKRRHMVVVAGGAVFLVVLVIAGRIFLLRRSVGVYRDFWTQQNKQAPNEGALTYIALGDSAAQGIGASEPMRGYVGLIAGEYAKTANRPVHIINLSVSGAQIEDVLYKQLPELATLPDPDLMTIEIGANNIPSFNSDIFKTQYQTLLARLPAGTYVADVPSFKGTIRGGFDKNVVAANTIISSLLSDHKNLKPVLLYKETSRQGFNNGAADSFHPNNSGYKNWARAFLNSIHDR